MLKSPDRMALNYFLYLKSINMFMLNQLYKVLALLIALIFLTMRKKIGEIFFYQFPYIHLKSLLCVILLYYIQRNSLDVIIAIITMFLQRHLLYKML